MRKFRDFATPLLRSILCRDEFPRHSTRGPRALRARGEVLKKTRGTQAYLDCGDFYVLDVAIGAVVRKHVDLDELGREVGALQPHEELA